MRRWRTCNGWWNLMRFSWRRCSSSADLWETGTAAAKSYGRRCDLLGRLGLLRIRAWHRPPHRRQGTARNRRGTSRTRQPGSDQRQFSRAGTRPRYRNIVRLHVDHRRNRSGTGRVGHRTRFLEVGLFHQCANRAAGGSDHCLESPGKQRWQASYSFDWAGGMVTAFGFGGVVYALIESKPLAGAAGAIGLVVLLYWETHISSPMVPLWPVPLQEFQRSQPADLFSLCGVERLMLFFLPLDLIQVQGYSPTEAGAALLPFILLMFLLSRWSGGLVRSLWGQSSPDSGSADRSRGIRAVCQAGHWRFVLGDVLPGSGGAGFGHGGQRRSTDYDRDERCGPERGWNGFWHQQCSITNCSLTGRGRVRNGTRHSFQ